MTKVTRHPDDVGIADWKNTRATLDATLGKPLDEQARARLVTIVDWAMTQVPSRPDQPATKSRWEGLDLQAFIHEGLDPGNMVAATAEWALTATAAAYQVWQAANPNWEADWADDEKKVDFKCRCLDLYYLYMRLTGQERRPPT